MKDDRDAVGAPLTRRPPVEVDVAYEVTPPGVPESAAAIYDRESGAIIGYRVQIRPGLIQLHDLSGKPIATLPVEEPGLEGTLVDPVDLVLIAAGTLKLLLGGAVRLGALLTRSTSRALPGGWTMALQSMRGALRALRMQELKFTAKTSAHMDTPGRFVPVHVLRQGIRYGTRVPDPDGVPGAFQYTTRMFRHVWRNDRLEIKEYTLQIVIQESDWTVLHFHYQP